MGPSNPASLVDFLHENERARAERDSEPRGSSVNHLASEFLSAGYRVLVVSHCPGREHEEYCGERLKFVSVASRRRARDVALSLWSKERSAMVRVIRAHKPQIVHAHWTYEFALAALDSGFPVVITARDAPWTIFRQFYDPYRFIRFLLAHWVAFRARFRQVPISAVSPYLAAAWRREMLWFHRMPVIPNVVEERHRSASKKANPFVLEIANSSPMKNVSNLIIAMSKVREDIPRARLALVGNGLGLNDELFRWAQSKGLAEGIDFLGPLAEGEVHRLMSSARVHAHVSREESFGRTVLEALVAGTAVLGGSNSGAVPWILEGGKAGLVVDIEDSNRIAEGICQLLTNSKLRRNLVRRGKRRSETLFSPKAAVDAHLALYENALLAQSSSA